MTSKHIYTSFAPWNCKRAFLSAYAVWRIVPQAKRNFLR